MRTTQEDDHKRQHTDNNLINTRTSAADTAHYLAPKSSNDVFTVFTISRHRSSSKISQSNIFTFVRVLTVLNRNVAKIERLLSVPFVIPP
ncbi:hypothetical protein N7509_000049 [Penicillium cosmopolitanum]|uniref:Uncharacterized protein n=1 Tax=Penicillium cosmopolitanum TaxID=1131564 RepID=A0A9W9WCJ2_9EURO|nr:uncharacterized protein N7509_000049 [Penicillium cosmopolitanum]KAJ5414951.1 hypothetical protein N7509_000049 [Penicillium cosmopolitanum]